MSLIDRAKKGDLDALSELIEQYELILYKTAKAILNNEDDVSDAIQEALISIYKHLGNLQQEKYFKTWATRILINKCYDIIYKNDLNKRKTEKIQEKYMVKEESIDNNIVEKTELQRALNILEEDLRLVTIMYYYDDFSIKEISKILDVPVGTVKSRLSRAREKLLTELRQEEVNETNEK